MRRVVGPWLAIAWLGFAVLPWNAVGGGGFFTFDWTHQYPFGLASAPAMVVDSPAPRPAGAQVPGDHGAH